MHFQGGFSLLVVLVFLVVLGLLGFSVTQSAIIQERITGNVHEKNLSFLAAEAAMREAEVYLTTIDDLDVLASSVTRTAVTSLPGLDRQPSYTISCVTAGCSTAGDGRVYYRVTAQGWGARRTSVTSLESIVWVDE